MLTLLQSTASELPGPGTIAIMGLLTIAVLSIVMGSARKMSRERHREESRREIAAYVAEGSMSAEDAEKILAAGVKNRC